MHHESDLTRYPEDAVQRILKRAMELDQERRETISAQDLRAIARELGISATALDHAIAEVPPVHPTQQLSTVQTGKTKLRFPVWALVAGGFAGLMTRGTWPFAMGLFGRTVSGSDLYITMSTMLLLQCGAVTLGMMYRGPSRHRKFQLANVVLWGGFVLGWSYMIGGIFPYFLSAVVPAAAITGLVGGAAIWIRDRLAAMNHSDSTGEPGGTSHGLLRSWKVSALRGLRTLLRPWTGMIKVVADR